MTFAEAVQDIIEFEQQTFDAPKATTFSIWQLSSNKQIVVVEYGKPAVGFEIGQYDFRLEWDIPTLEQANEMVAAIRKQEAFYASGGHIYAPSFGYYGDAA